MRNVPNAQALPRRSASRLAAAIALVASGSAAAQAEAPWEWVGRQGVIQVVIVPQAQAADRDAYARQIKRLCAAGQSCFINFFSNSSAAPAGLPLPDAIAGEATAIYRHSVKHGGEMFRWSCRVNKDAGDCF